MERGYVKVYRKMLDSGLLQHPTALQVFMYLLLSAAHTPRKQILYGQQVELEKGEVITGRLRLASELGITEKQARVALELLKRLDMVATKGANKYTIVSIVNWDIYQNVGPTEGPAKKRAKGQTRATEQELLIKNKEDSESKDSSSSTASDAAELVLKGKHKTIKGRRAEAFNRFWEAFSYKKDKAQAIDAWAALPPLTDAFVDRICDAAKQEAARRPDYEAKGRSPQYAQGWINGRRWEDEPDEPQVQLINVWRKRDA